MHVQISCNSAFLCTSPSAATFTQDGPSSDSNPLDGGSANPPSEAPLRLPEKPNQRVFNYVEDQLQRHMHMPYQLWAGSELRSIEEHVVALDVILQVCFRLCLLKICAEMQVLEQSNVTEVGCI